MAVMRLAPVPEIRAAAAVASVISFHSVTTSPAATSGTIDSVIVSTDRSVFMAPSEGKRLGLRPLAARPLDRFRERALREDTAEVRLVLDRALEIGLHVHALRGLLRRGLDRRRVELLADEPRLDALGPYGLGAGAGDGDAGLGADALLVEGDRGADADHGEARRRVRELQVGGARARSEQRDAHLDEQLPVLERRRHEAEEPLVRGD